ncbi:phage tail fiber protein [Paenibacillus sinopodophylli]|uniref:phage tail fiber protein n=1 Tax=Paenibacillus sinopodophylli TaxID=1837342 RepID=UPI00110D15D3|nr:hypothetical protein [Paenibacillus sinopodophylli]
MAISNYQAARNLNALRGVAFTPPSAVYLALYTSNPTAANTGSEVAGGAYARQLITLSAAALDAGKMAIKLLSDAPFPVATANWGLVSHVGVTDALTGGNLLHFAEIDSRTIQTNDRFIAEASKILIRYAQ